MAHRLPERIVEYLNDAINSATLERAGFDSVAPTDGMKVIVEGKWGRTEYDGSITDFIRGKVRLHHSSWIIGPLRAILDWSEKTDDGSMREYDLMGRLTGPWPNPEVLKEAASEVAALREEVAELRAFKNKVISALKSLQA